MLVHDPLAASSECSLSEAMTADVVVVACRHAEFADLDHPAVVWT